jgi:hypothetical protein
MEIHWPSEYRPESCAVHVRNELLMSGVELENVWAWLARPELWPGWYPNSGRVRRRDSGELRLGSEFRWRTFGVTIDSRVLECVPLQRLAWDAHCNGVHACHAWAMERREGGVYVLTEETQNGWLAWLGARTLPWRMVHWHQHWLEDLEKIARSGTPGR